MIALVARSIGRIARLLCAVLLMLVGFQIAVTAAAATFADGGDFERLATIAPAFFRQALGPLITSFDGVVLIGYIDGLVVMMFVQMAIYIATEPAGEVESHVIDLVLARPLPRHWLVTRSVLVMMVTMIALGTALVGGSWLSLVWLAPDGVRWPAPKTIGLLAAHLVSIAWCFGAAALAASGCARRRGAALGAVAVAAVASYLVEFLGMMWTRAEPLSRLSPFHYYRGSNIVAGTADSVTDLGVLGTLTLLGLAIAYWQFNRRDL